MYNALRKTTMSSYHITQSESHIEFTRRMSPGFRLVLVLLGLFPLIAPYELLIKPAWRDWFNPFFLFFLAISLGAVAVSVGFIMAGLAGLSQRIRFDIPARTLIYESDSLLARFRQTRYRFSDIERIDLIEHDWSEGPATFYLQVKIRNSAKIEFGDLDSRADAERYQQILQRLLDRASV
jgi:hypothetical protein